MVMVSDKVTYPRRCQICRRNKPIKYQLCGTCQEAVTRLSVLAREEAKKGYNGLKVLVDGYRAMLDSGRVKVGVKVVGAAVRLPGDNVPLTMYERITKRRS